MAISSLKRLIKKLRGAMIPCHKPPRNPLGSLVTQAVTSAVSAQAVNRKSTVINTKKTGINVDFENRFFIVWLF